MAGPRILVVEHEDSCPPALFGDWLVEAGCLLEVCRPYAGDALPALTAYDGVLVLGGEMGANDDDAHPWLTPLKAGIRDAVEAGTPLLGICLGHQLVAAALGGVVERNPRGQTVGLQPVGWTEEAASAIARLAKEPALFTRLLSVNNGTRALTSAPAHMGHGSWVT